MKKTLFPLTVLVVLFTGYSLSWLRGDPRARNAPLGTVSAVETSALLRHKHAQPSHWRGLVLRTNH